MPSLLASHSCGCRLNDVPGSLWITFIIIIVIIIIIIIIINIKFFLIKKTQTLQYNSGGEKALIRLNATRSLLFLIWLNGLNLYTLYQHLYSPHCSLYIS